MTVIVGLVENNKVYMAGDLLISTDYAKTIRKDSKVFIKENMLIGTEGSVRMNQLLQYSLVIPEHANTQSVDEYMRTTFVDAVRELFKQNGFASINDNTERGGYFMVGYKGRLFVVQDDFSVLEYAPPYFAIGSGDQFALGAMFASEGQPPAKRLRTAIEAACEFAPHVGGCSEVYVVAHK